MGEMVVFMCLLLKWLYCDVLCGVDIDVWFVYLKGLFEVL